MSETSFFELTDCDSDYLTINGLAHEGDDDLGYILASPNGFSFDVDAAKQIIKNLQERLITASGKKTDVAAVEDRSTDTIQNSANLPAIHIEVAGNLIMQRPDNAQ